jgi:glycosyltransferase involved in cell wall biosynthesis
MKILFINRDKNYNGFSVEELFYSIQENIKNEKVEFENYYYDSTKSLYHNLKNIKKINADIYHITSGVVHLAYFLDRKKTIYTIHDINRYLYVLKGFRKLFYKIYYLNPLKRVKYITAISEKIKNDLIVHLGIKANHITVIYNCYPDDFEFNNLNFNTEKPNLLHIGTKEWKNLDLVISALEGVKCTLSIVGKLTNQQIELLNHYKIDYTNKYNLSRVEIYQEYCNCDMVIFPSSYEGFGMPIVEAHAVGRPILISNIEVLNEVANGAAHVINENNSEEIKNGILKIISDSAYRDKLIDKGKENNKRFTPKVIANKYLNLYKTIFQANS